MNTTKHFLVVCAGVALGLALTSGVASAQYPAVSYYPAPAVSYYPAPVSVTTTRYGVFGLRQATTVTYGAAVPAYGSFVVPQPVVASYYAPAPTVVRSFLPPRVYVQPTPYVLYR